MYFSVFITHSLKSMAQELPVVSTRDGCMRDNELLVTISQRGYGSFCRKKEMVAELELQVGI